MLEPFHTRNSVCGQGDADSSFYCQSSAVLAMNGIISALASSVSHPGTADHTARVSGNISYHTLSTELTKMAHL